MAKRKRLTPANPEYFTTPPATRAFALAGAAPVAQVAGDSAAAAALTELSETLRQAREEGRLVLTLPLEAIDTDYLVRDRIRADDAEMEALYASMAARGQQTPIEVVALPADRYGLISGWRRLTALKRLAAERPGEGFETVLALLRRHGDSAESYLAMVEENEIRVGLSHYERARIAARSVEMGIFPDTGLALRTLFASASRAKRSKIRSFMSVVAALDPVLRFPEAIGERLGLRLAAALEADPKLGGRVTAQLARADAQNPDAEKTALEAALKRPAARKSPAPAPTPARAADEEPCTGVFLRHDAGDRLMLYGPGVTPELTARLRAFLAGL